MYLTFPWHANFKFNKQAYLSWFTTPAYVLDFESYVAVRKTWYSAAAYRSMILATGVFGKFDRVISNDVEQEMP